MAEGNQGGDQGNQGSQGNQGAGGNQPNWYDGRSADEIGYFQNRGWDKLTPAEAAFQAGKAHREAEKLIGAPADQLVRLPKGPADAEGIKALYDRLGVPADEKGYDFAGVKLGDGSELGDTFKETLGKALLQAGVPKDKGADIVRAIVSLADNDSASEATARADALNAQRDALRIDWGGRTEANLVIAKEAARTLGVDPEAVAALENQVGYAAVMKMFHNIGVKLGEDAFVGDPGGASNGGTVRGMTVGQAQATLDARMNDSAWATKLMNGDVNAVNEFNNLTRVVSAAR